MFAKLDANDKQTRRAEPTKALKQIKHFGVEPFRRFQYYAHRIEGRILQ